MLDIITTTTEQQSAPCTITERESFGLLIRGYLKLSRIQTYLFRQSGFDTDFAPYRMISNHICQQFVTQMTWSELLIAQDIFFDARGL